MSAILTSTPHGKTKVLQMFNIGYDHRLRISQKNLSENISRKKYIFDILFQTNIFGEGFLGNCSDFKLENRMYIHVCSALKEWHIIYHLFNQLWWFLKEKAPIDGGKGGFTSHTLTVPRPKSLLFSLWSLNMLIIALNCYHFQNNCLVSLQNFVNENELGQFWNL